ncbi:MAG TPA: transglutaminase domain-containing protein, partial [Ktedonobacterales bacterium]|nr:transglutaminase domain-containing protein [Ktedonobacterales bacterium]
WARTPAGRVGPLTYTSPNGTPVAVLGAPLSLNSPNVISNQIILTYSVLEGPIATPPLLGATLDTFDGSAWTQGPAAADVSVHSPLAAPKDAQRLTVRVTVYTLPQSDHGTYLLGFDQPLAFSVPASARLLDGTAPDPLTIASWQTSQPLSQGTGYTVQSAILTDDVAAQGTVPAVVLQRMLQLPAPVDSAAMSLARQWVGKATTPRAQSEGLLAGLTTAVTYDGAATPPDGADVVTWTLQHKRASAVALTTTYILLGRALGLPLRMAEGYLPGTFDVKLKHMVVRGSDAAVWAQLAVPGAGWFDLFPASRSVTVSVPSKIIYKGAPTPTQVPTSPTPTPAST